MFCPHCGAKNDGTPIQCTSCKKSIPPIGGITEAAPKKQRKPEVAVTGTERFSSLGNRMLALFFDRVVVLAFLLIAAAIVADPTGGVPAEYRSGTLAGVLAGVALVFAVFIYHVVCEAGFGTTLGKAVMGLQVQGDGERNRFLAVVIRNALRIVDGIAVYAVGFVMATFSPQRQRFGDSVAGTVVLDIPMSKGGRAALMVLWVALIAVAVGIAAALCPTCRP